MRVYSNKILISFITISLFFSLYSFFNVTPRSYNNIAHRGASSIAPENTLAAFHEAYEQGYDFIEFDVRMSKDKKIIIIHDETVNRTTDGEGYVHEMTLEELKRLDAGSWFHHKYEGEKIPELNEVFEEFGKKIGLLIEIKATPNYDELVIKVADFIQEKLNEGYDPSRIQVQSFIPKDMELFNSLLPIIKVGVIIKNPIHIFLLANYRHFASFLAIHYQYVSKSLIETAKMLNYEVYIWTIKYPTQFYFVEPFSVHGIISNVMRESITN